MPLLLPAPKLLEFEQYRQNLRDVFCYVLRHWGGEGISVLYCKQGDDVFVQIGDWAGQKLDLQSTDNKYTALARTFLEQHSLQVFQLLSAIKLHQAQLFFSDNLTLCDLQMTVNKLSGPGMLQNLFGTIVRTPEVLKIENIDQRASDAIIAGFGTYEGNLVLKPSRFRQLEIQTNRFTPLHVQVMR